MRWVEYCYLAVLDTVLTGGSQNSGCNKTEIKENVNKQQQSEGMELFTEAHKDTQFYTLS
jgi:ABC-type molybdenum transport system ATPase subunit/photorepair protein PhrA